MAFPPKAREDIDWTSPAMALTQPNGHIQSRWSKKTGQWSAPEFITDPYLKVHGLATVFHYGQEIYEGMKAFRGPDNQVHILRPKQHAARLNQSAELVSIQPVPESHFLQCVKLAVAMNADLVPPHGTNAMLYVRPFVFGSGPWFQLSPTDEYLLCVFVAPTLALHGVKPIDALILDEFDRAAPRGVGAGKVGGNYAPVMRWSEKAKAEGFPITLHLDSQTRSEIEEFSTSGFVGIYDGGNGRVRLVVPDSKNIVPSITSESIQELARSLGWAVEKRAIKYEELPRFSEVLACGTGVTMVPIKSITRKSTGDRFVYQDDGSEPGPVVKLLSSLIDDIYKGKTEDRFRWLARVGEPTGVNGHA
ncbi:branched-chain amino acid aminotransferase II [Triangularia verruculosa]|uniref:Branched-chain amino acid aminotransferase II n=1 Tax=Triangularia verruculosa TaxID=2587418 RepID=A0AAN6XGP6_9PEZI|nr:branched-chain amino acid aminotransferase II [Triangularia verruculosa]